MYLSWEVHGFLNYSYIVLLKGGSNTKDSIIFDQNVK